MSRTHSPTKTTTPQTGKQGHLHDSTANPLPEELLEGNFLQLHHRHRVGPLREVGGHLHPWGARAASSSRGTTPALPAPPRPLRAGELGATLLGDLGCHHSWPPQGTTPGIYGGWFSGTGGFKDQGMNWLYQSPKVPREAAAPGGAKLRWRNFLPRWDCLSRGTSCRLKIAL